METALNLCWLVVAAAAYGLWLRRPRYRGRPMRSHQEWLVGTVVLACVLFLIFPVISVSDDVRAAREFLEEPYSDQPLVKSLEVQKRVVARDLPTPEAAVAQPAPGPGIFPTVGIVHVADPLTREFEPLRPAHGRSPPLA